MQHKYANADDFYADLHEQDVSENIQNLQAMRRIVASYSKDIHLLESLIASKLHHEIDGQKTYKIDDYDVTVISGHNYCVDKNAYQQFAKELPQRFDLIKEKISYEVSAKVFKEALKYATKTELNVINKVVNIAAKRVRVEIKSK